LSDHVEVFYFSGELPEDFQLFQNYPNPFNLTTTIAFDVKNKTQVRLKIYDLQGCEVLTLLNETCPTGHIKVRFNAEGLPSGIYFYRIQMDDFQAVKRMILIK